MFNYTISLQNLKANNISLPNQTTPNALYRNIWLLDIARAENVIGVLHRGIEWQKPQLTTACANKNEAYKAFQTVIGLHSPWVCTVCKPAWFYSKKLFIFNPKDGVFFATSFCIDMLFSLFSIEGSISERSLPLPSCKV